MIVDFLIQAVWSLFGGMLGDYIAFLFIKVFKL